MRWAEENPDYFGTPEERLKWETMTPQQINGLDHEEIDKYTRWLMHKKIKPIESGGFEVPNHSVMLELNLLLDNILCFSHI